MMADTHHQYATNPLARAAPLRTHEQRISERVFAAYRRRAAPPRRPPF